MASERWLVSHQSASLMLAPAVAACWFVSPILGIFVSDDQARLRRDWQSPSVIVGLTTHAASNTLIPGSPEMDCYHARVLRESQGVAFFRAR